MKNFVYLSFFTAFVALSWIIFSVIHNSTTSTITQDTGIIIKPINSKFDIKTLDGIKKRKNLSVNLSEEIATPSSIILTPTPNPSGTESAEVIQSQEASKINQSAQSSIETNL